MTLAFAILLLFISNSPFDAEGNPALSPPVQAGPATTSTSQSIEEQNGADAHQSKPPASTTTDTQKSSTQKATAPKKRVQKKKVAAPGCDKSATDPKDSSASNSAAGTHATPDASENSASAKNCPPEKIIVRQGGTAEPSIQLAGGDPASQKRDATNQMLGSTEANLKRLAGMSLNSAQEDTVSQIRQFVEQSKQALVAGDVERGQTLAWKAKLLSEDLVNPQK